MLDAAMEFAAPLRPWLVDIRARAGRVVKPTHAPGAKVGVKAVAQLGTEMAQMSGIRGTSGEAVSAEDVQAAALAAN